MKNTATCFICATPSKTDADTLSAFEYCQKCKKSTHHLVSIPQKTTEYKDLAELQQRQKI
jgi:hypothetical protein